MKSGVVKKEWLVLTIFGICITLVLFSSVRGRQGNPTIEELSTVQWRAGGPLELSPERGRFALTYSVVEDKSLQFSVPLARFVTPDLAINPKGEYVSLFAPGVSFLAIPGFIIGRYFGVSQVGAFATSALFALMNLFLIAVIVKRLGGNTVTGLLSGMVFAFATPAFTYASTLYQHHISTFILLLSIYVLIRWNGFLSLASIWFLCALSVVIDNPNIFFMFPVGVMALGRIIWMERQGQDAFVQIRPLKIFAFIGMVLPVLFFLWFNQVSNGSPLKLSGTLQSVAAIDANGNPTQSELAKSLNLGDQKSNHEKTAVSFFNTRNLFNGFYIHSISPDRGMISFTPVMLLGIWGLVFIYRRYAKWGALLLTVILVDILLYSMWGDPWGGWAFGSRYLIPTYALLSIGVGVLLHQRGKSTIVFIVFLVLFTGSVAINTLGALTTSTNPPQVEVLAIEKLSGHEEKYTFMRNWQYLQTNGSKSFVYQSWAYQYVSPVKYYGILVSAIVIMGEILLLIASGESVSKISRRTNDQTV